MQCGEAGQGTVGTIDPFGQKMLGLEMRVMYQKEVFTHPSDRLDRLVDRLRFVEDESAQFREHIRTRLGEITNSETVFLEESPVFAALARMVYTDRESAYSTLCNALWLFGRTQNHRPNVHGHRTINEWGGWPQFEGVPEGEQESERYWFLLTMAVQPKCEAEWRRFAADATCFIFSLMLRHGSTPHFWDQLRLASHGSFSRAVDEHRSGLGRKGERS